jgi:hypothetical protein
MTISITTLSKEDTQLIDSQHNGTLYDDNWHNNNHECNLRDFQIGAMIMNLMTLCLMTLSITALSIMTLSITALSIMTISIATLSIECQNAEWHIFLLLC